MQQAFAVYIEFLGWSLVSKSFADKVQSQTLSRKHLTRYESAARQVENLICTHRESLLGSSAWQRDFLDELQHRPFFMTQGTTSTPALFLCAEDEDYGDSRHRCHACGRVSKEEACHVVYLYGPPYSSMDLWSQNRWLRALPKEICLHQPARPRPQYASYEEEAEALEQGAAAEVMDDTVEEEEVLVSPDRAKSSAMRNKQFRAFQAQHPDLAPSPSVTLSGVKRKVADATVTSSTPKAREEDSEQMKKRKVILLSDSEEEGGGGREEDEEQQEEPGGDNVAEVEEVAMDRDRLRSQWWNKALPRVLNQSKETRWELSTLVFPSYIFWLTNSVDHISGF